MRFSLSWLHHHLATDAPLEVISERLTAIGLEVEKIEDASESLAPFTIAIVEDAWQHPGADRLRLCRVNTGTQTLQIVCGAHNARAGIKVVLALPGAVIPRTGKKLEAGVIRGEKSEGMMCSKWELLLGEDHDGIIELPQDAPLGEKYAAWAGLDDPIIEINLTPNRGDCAGVRGIARDLAASGLGVLKPLASVAVQSTFSSHLGLHVSASEQAPFFMLRPIRGVKNIPSPAWLVQLLEKAGVRSISALVDITNFFCFDLGRPLHVFDANKVKGDVRLHLSKEGEEFTALNGKDYRLAEGLLTISDAEGCISLAGVMGGARTGCDEETHDILLEVALFDPAKIAEAGRTLQLFSDSRYRFERGVDVGLPLLAAELATAMIIDICGGEAGEPIIAGALPSSRSPVLLRAKRVEQIGGVVIDAHQQQDILEKLGCTVEAVKEGWQVIPPSWRPDIKLEIDLVEEILRLNGYQHIISSPLPDDGAVAQLEATASSLRYVIARRILALRGLREVVSWSFTDAKIAKNFNGGDEESLTLLNPISQDLAVMRPSILAHLLAMLGRNARNGANNGLLFEIGPVFGWQQGKDVQQIMAAGVRCSFKPARHWDGSQLSTDWLEAKADALAALEAIGAPVSGLQVVPAQTSYFHPGKSGCLRLGNQILAIFGELHPSLCAAEGIDRPIAAFEVYLDKVQLPKQKTKARPAPDFSAFQPITRDFAFLVAENSPASGLLKAVKGANKIITDVELFDRYAGKNCPTGMVSLAVTVTLQPREKSLNDEEIEAISKTVVESAAKVGAILRG
ncbi:MAG: phenylalanine--tRNA ligase subunit beta [Alphaproteobacteria bacterium]